MIEKRVVLVLGAGASFPFGFPLGSGLLSATFGLGPGNEYFTFLVNSGFDPVQISHFQQDLKLSGRSSIDAFLETNPQYVRLGKAIISLLISSHETEENLYNPVNPENWYKYLFDILIAGVNLRELPEISLSVATYNYDRSLEFFLFNAIQRLVPEESPSAVFSIYKRIRICHIHGLLDDAKLYPERPGREYRPVKTKEELESSIEKIGIIHEFARDQGNYPVVYNIMARAQSIVLLGFGYNSANLQRLKLETFVKGNAQVFGSTFGLTDSEVWSQIQKHTNGTYEHKKVLDFLRDRLEIFND